jgi:hypothetical protein
LFVGHEGQFPYRATIDWLVEAIPDATARAKIFGATARALLQRRVTDGRPSHRAGIDAVARGRGHKPRRISGPADPAAAAVPSRWQWRELASDANIKLQ